MSPPPLPFNLLPSEFQLHVSIFWEDFKPQWPGHAPDQLNTNFGGTEEPSTDILKIPLVSPVCGQVEEPLF